MQKRLTLILTLFLITGLAMPSEAIDIHEAVIKGNLEAVQTILEENEDLLESRNSDNLTVCRPDRHLN